MVLAVALLVTKSKFAKNAPIAKILVVLLKIYIYNAVEIFGVFKQR